MAQLAPAGINIIIKPQNQTHLLAAIFRISSILFTSSRRRHVNGNWWNWRNCRAAGLTGSGNLSKQNRSLWPGKSKPLVS
jgi:hypothetical protein